MNNGSSAEGCPECGAKVGHREVSATACSLGLDAVPRAEHERAKTQAAINTEVYIRCLKDALASRDAYLANLTATQARCTALLEELRRVREMHTTQAGTIRSLVEEIQDLKVQLEMADPYQ